MSSPTHSARAIQTHPNLSAAPAGNRWAIVLSSRATKELRQLERNQNALEIVHKKIRELSLGLFSTDNHRTLVGSAQHIPIFRARVASNLRIIYQIDVLPDTSGLYDHQVIKIHQIIARDRVDYNLWVKASARLKRVNTNYRERCVYRLPPTTSTQDKYRPTMFTHEDYGLSISNQDSGFLLEDLNEEEKNQIQEITMERFAPLSKSLYNSVAADLNMAFPMVLDEHERKIVNHTGASIVIGRSGTGKTTALIYKMRAIDQTNAIQGGNRAVRQLFVTRSRVLAQHVEATYQGLLEFTNIAEKSVDELKEIAKRSREDPDRALVEFDSEVDLRDDLPERFSSLGDSHFPLFISFDKLCSMLEADIRHAAPGQIGALKSRSLVEFDDFLHNYWPSFRGLTQTLEPNLVYSEIIGVIKGSQAALESSEGYLSRSEYVESLSYRQFPLLAQARAKVYSIFEIYTKHKASRFETDAADRTRLILRNLHHIIREPTIDYLYVDEVQDNLMIDVHLLRSLAKNINNIYWSGDSAQTVVAGSAFRINDLKAFTYRDQVDFSTSRSIRKAEAQFTTFELNVNFRSLSGIVQFAGFLVQSIHKLFPESIDLMETEKAKYYGDPPVLFTNIQSEAGYFEKFLLGSSASNRVVFGAQQAILVRDAEAAEQLDARLQGLCNILPIMDSKGLEFDDVLIYNFFSQSAASPSAWEHLLGDVRGNQAPPPVLCSELKLLYVAATRARRRCWIWDSGPTINRLKALWTSHGLIKVEPATQMIGRIASTSSKAEWAAKGREYFSHRLYKLAAACFRQADKENDAKLSLAYHLMTRAKLKRLRGDTPAARADLITAASELETCANLPGIGNASNVHYHAAACYETARDLVRACCAFVKAGRHTHGVQILFDAHDFINGSKALVDNRKYLEQELFVSLREQARLHFFNRREYSYLAPLFDTVDEKITYAKDHKFKAQLKHLLEEHRRYDELATEYLEERNLNQGVGCYVKAYRHHHTRPSIIRAVDVSIKYIESVLLVEGLYRKKAHDLAKSLIEKVQPYACQTDTESCLTVDLYYEHLCSNGVNLDTVNAWNLEDKQSQQPNGTLARYLAVKDNYWLKDDSVDVVLGYLEVWESFKASILGIAESIQPSASTLAQKLLGFSIQSPGSKSATSGIVQDGSLIYQRINNSSDDDDGDESTKQVSSKKIDSIIREELSKRLYAMLDSLHNAALASHWTQPLRFSSSPAKPSLRQVPNGIITSDDMRTPKIHVLCKILGVLATTNAAASRDYTVLDQQWLQRMFRIIYPISGEVGWFYVLHAVPNSDKTAACLRAWLRREWEQLRKREASDGSLTHHLLYSMIRSALCDEFLGQGHGLHESELARYAFNDSLIQPLRRSFSGRDRFSQAVLFLERVLNQNYRADAAVMISFVEMITREMMLYKCLGDRPDFDLLLMPFSWVRALAYKYSSTTPLEPSNLNKFFPLLKQLSLELRFGAPGRWLIDGKQGSAATVNLLNLRLCWCLAFVIGHMSDGDQHFDPAMTTLKSLASDDIPREYSHRHTTAAGLYHEFSQVTSQKSCVEVLCRTFRHESLVLLLESPERYHLARYMPSVHTIICESPSKLVGRLEKILEGGSLDSDSETTEEEYDPFAPPDDEEDDPREDDYYDHYESAEEYEPSDEDHDMPEYLYDQEEDYESTDEE